MRLFQHALHKVISVQAHFLLLLDTKPTLPNKEISWLFVTELADGGVVLDSNVTSKLITD